LERHFGYAAALAARGLKHFTGALAAPRAAAALRTHGFARLTAIRTAVGLILKTFGGVELLFTGRKRKFTSTVNTIQTFIGVH